jgi:hypothetical protein
MVSDITKDEQAALFKMTYDSISHYDGNLQNRILEL